MNGSSLYPLALALIRAMALRRRQRQALWYGDYEAAQTLAYQEIKAVRDAWPR